MTNIKTEVEAESTEAAQLAQHALDAAIAAIQEWQDDLGLCEAPFRITLHVDNGNEADREVSAPLDEAAEIIQRTGQYDDGWIRHDGGERPVQAMDMVRVCLRSGKMNPARVARSWYWPHVEIEFDITHYQPLRDPDGIPYCSAYGLETWAEYVVTNESGEVSQYSIRPEPKGLCDAPKQFANTHDHWTQTLRRVWRPEDRHV